MVDRLVVFRDHVIVVVWTKNKFIYLSLDLSLKFKYLLWCWILQIFQMIRKFSQLYCLCLYFFFKLRNLKGEWFSLVSFKPKSF